jgi:hypothetical protein
VITLKHPPDAALQKLAREILFALINREFGIILGKLGHERGRWTSEKIRDALLAATAGAWVSEFLAIRNSPAPELTGDESCYEYRHRIPLDGAWSEARLILRLHRRHQSLYALELVGFSA